MYQDMGEFVNLREQGCLSVVVAEYVVAAEPLSRCR